MDWNIDGYNKNLKTQSQIVLPHLHQHYPSLSHRGISDLKEQQEQVKYLDVVISVFHPDLKEKVEKYHRVINLSFLKQKAAEIKKRNIVQ